MYGGRSGVDCFSRAAPQCVEVGFDTTHYLRIQLRRGHLRVQKTRPHPRAQGAPERRPAHGRRPQNTGKGNLFVIFGEPDIDILQAEGGQVRVKVNGVNVFYPNTGEVQVRSDGADGITCCFIDTSRAFDKPKSGRIVVKVINHLGDEVMKVFQV